MALLFGEQPCSTWLPPWLGLAAVYFVHFWDLGKPAFCLPNLPGWPGCCMWPLFQGLALPLPRVQESRLYPIHLVLIPDMWPPLPSSPRPTLLITVSFRPLPFTSVFCPDSLDLTVILRASGILVPASLIVL